MAKSRIWIVYLLLASFGCSGKSWFFRKQLQASALQVLTDQIYYMHCLVILLSVTFSLSSNNSHGFEGFFLSDGTLVVGVTWKKEYTTAMVHSVILNDHQWHSVCISFNPSRCEIVLRSRLSAVFLKSIFICFSDLDVFLDRVISRFMWMAHYV